MKIACLWVPELSLIAALRAEPQLCTEPLAVVQAGVGGRAAVGLGSSKSVARLAARAASADLTLEASASGVGGGAFRVVPGEEQREFLAALPLYALELPDELQEPLRRFGLSTLGEVAALPP